MLRLWHSAIHVPCEYAQLRNARRIDASCIDRDVDRLAKVSLRIACLCPLEKQLARRQIREQVSNLLAIVSIHVAEVI